MLKLIAAFFISLWLANAALAQNAPACNRVAAGSANVGTTAVVSGVAGKQINICGYVANAVATSVIQFVFGTGGTCTSPVSIAPTYSLANPGDTIVDHIPTAFAASAPGQSLCAVVGTAATLYTVYYILTP